MGSDYIAKKELTLPGPPELRFTMLHVSAGVLGFTRAGDSEPAPTSVQSSLEPHHGGSAPSQRGRGKGEVQSWSPAQGSSVPGEAVRVSRSLAND